MTLLGSTVAGCQPRKGHRRLRQMTVASRRWHRSKNRDESKEAPKLADKVMPKACSCLALRGAKSRASNKDSLHCGKPLNSTTGVSRLYDTSEMSGLGTYAVVAAKTSIRLAFVTRHSVDENRVVNAIIAASLATGSLRK